MRAVAVALAVALAGPAACVFAPRPVAVVPHMIGYGGLWFADPACAARFARPRLVTGADVDALETCLAGLGLHRDSRRRHPLIDGAIYRDRTGLELRARFLDVADGRRLGAIGFAIEDAPTITPEALEALRLAGARQPVLEDAARAMLARAVADGGVARAAVWFRVCVDEGGAVTTRAVWASRPEAIAVLRAAIDDWRFRPFAWGGAARAVCALVRVQDPPPAAGEVERLPLTTLPAPHVVVGRLPPWVRGERRPALDPAMVGAAGRLGLRLAAAVRYCIDQTGRVTDAVVVEPSGAPAFDDALVGVVRTWVLDPYRVHGQATPVCGFMAHRIRTRATR